jgi:hypothetical protein
MAHGIDPSVRRLIESIEAWPAAVLAAHGPPQPPPPAASHRTERPLRLSASGLAPASRRLPSIGSAVPQRPDEPYTKYRGTGMGPNVSPGCYDGLHAPHQRGGLDSLLALRPAGGGGPCAHVQTRSVPFRSGVARLPAGFGASRTHSNGGSNSLYAYGELPAATQRKCNERSLNNCANVSFRSVVPRDPANYLQNVMLAEGARTTPRPSAVPYWHDAPPAWEGPSGPFPSRAEHARVLAAAREGRDHRNGPQ